MKEEEGIGRHRRRMIWERDEEERGQEERNKIYAPKSCLMNNAYKRVITEMRLGF